jgi:hypothetical protein
MTADTRVTFVSLQPACGVGTNSLLAWQNDLPGYFPKTYFLCGPVGSPRARPTNGSDRGFASLARSNLIR